MEKFKKKQISYNAITINNHSLCTETSVKLIKARMTDKKLFLLLQKWLLCLTIIRALSCATLLIRFLMVRWSWTHHIDTTTTIPPQPAWCEVSLYFHFIMITQTSCNKQLWNSLCVLAEQDAFQDHYLWNISEWKCLEYFPVWRCLHWSTLEYW